MDLCLLSLGWLPLETLHVFKSNKSKHSCLDFDTLSFYFFCNLLCFITKSTNELSTGSPQAQGHVAQRLHASVGPQRDLLEVQQGQCREESTGLGPPLTFFKAIEL